MTLDDVLNERFCRVTFVSRLNHTGSRRISCSIHFAIGPGTTSEHVMVTAAEASIFGDGPTVSEAFSEAVERLRRYQETLK